MALEELDQFLNRGFCIARGSLVWCLKSHYLEILKLNCLHLKKVLIRSTSIPIPLPRQPFKPSSNYIVTNIYLFKLTVSIQELTYRLW